AGKRPGHQDSAGTADSGHVLGKGGSGDFYYSSGQRRVAHPQYSLPIAVCQRRVGYVQPRDLSGERENVAGLDAVDDCGYLLGGHHMARPAIQIPLDTLDLPEHSVVLQGQVLRPMLRHESKWTAVFGCSQLRAHFSYQPAT